MRSAAAARKACFQITCHSVDGNVFRSMRSLHLSLESPGVPPKADKGMLHQERLLHLTQVASLQ